MASDLARVLIAYRRYLGWVFAAGIVVSWLKWQWVTWADLERGVALIVRLLGAAG